MSQVLGKPIAADCSWPVLLLRRLNASTLKTLEMASFLYALVELLDEQGFLTIEELDERKRIVGQRLVEQFQ